MPSVIIHFVVNSTWMPNQQSLESEPDEIPLSNELCNEKRINKLSISANTLF